MRKSWVLVALLVLPGFAQAQPNPQTPQAGAGSPSGALALPPPPAVDDPMLAPVPPPKRVLASWSQAVEYLRSRSTDLKIALDQVLQAEAQTRIALAQYLPWINANNAGGGTYTHPVSYTHLDVYKRQVGSSASIVPLETPGAYDGRPGGGGMVVRSLCRANSCGSNGGRTVVGSAPAFRDAEGLRFTFI